MSKYYIAKLPEEFIQDMPLFFDGNKTLKLEIISEESKKILLFTKQQDGNTLICKFPLNQE